MGLCVGLGLGVVFPQKRLWTPAELTIPAWLKGTVEFNGSNVSQWSDLTGNGNHATQGVEVSQPGYGSADKKVIFDGSDDFLNLTTAIKNILVRLSNHSLFIVFKADSPLSSSGIMFINAGVSSSNMSAFQIRSNLLTVGYYNGSSYTAKSTPFSDTAGKHIMSVTHASDANPALFLDGTEGTGSDHPYAAVIVGCILGRALDDQRHFNGDMFEIVIADSVLSDADRHKIEGYLAHDWDIEDSLPAGHPYKLSPPYV